MLYLKVLINSTCQLKPLETQINRIQNFSQSLKQISFSFIWTSSLQDVVEIMKESLYDKYVDEHGFVDFGRSGGMSQQKEAKRFLSALNKQSELQQKDCFSISVWSLKLSITSRSSLLCPYNQSYFLYCRKCIVWQIGLASEFQILIHLWIT